MKQNDEHIYSLIYRHLTGSITDEETSALEDWLKEDSRHQIEFAETAELWKRTETFKFPGKIDNAKALDAIHAKAGIRQPKTSNMALIRRIAAVVALSVLFSGLYSYFFSGNTDNLVYYEEIQAAPGTRTSIKLPDGSEVFLNSGSSLRFSNQFAGNGERLVELKGEGFFDVAKDPGRPFIVTVGQLEVKALGTAFNINAYEPGAQIDVMLTEGKVSVGHTSNKGIIVEPGQLASFNVVNNKLMVSNVANPGKYTGWIDGKLVFVDDPISHVISRLENWFNVDIVIADSAIANYRFTGTFIDESIEDVLEVFSMTSPLKYNISPIRRSSNGEYTKKQITLMSNRKNT